MNRPVNKPAKNSDTSGAQALVGWSQTIHSKYLVCQVIKTVGRKEVREGAGGTRAGSDALVRGVVLKGLMEEGQLRQDSREKGEASTTLLIGGITVFPAGEQSAAQ